MRTNATSAFYIPACLYFTALLLLLSASDRAYAKRGCSAFGHSCFGGHGKRFDPNIQDAQIQENSILANDPNQDYEGARMTGELFVDDPGHKFTGKLGKNMLSTRRAGTQQFEPYMLSRIIRQWLAVRSRPQNLDLGANNK